MGYVNFRSLVIMSTDWIYHPNCDQHRYYLLFDSLSTVDRLLINISSRFDIDCVIISTLTIVSVSRNGPEKNGN